MLDLTAVRSLGVRYLAVACVVSALIAMVWSLGKGATAFAVISIGIAILPAYIGFTGKSDMASRLLMGGTLPLFAALFVALAKGSGWTIDMHMVFFAFLAMVAIMADWRAVVVSTLVIAVHHLVLNYAAPLYVFPDGADLARVLFHAGVVIVEAVTLGLLCIRLEALFASNSSAREEQMAEQARRAEIQDKVQKEQKIVLEGIEKQLRALSEGDLLTRIENRFPGEYDDARKTLNNTCEDLRQIVGSIAQNSEQVGEGARQIKEASQTLAQNSERQANAIETVSSTAARLHDEFEANATLWRETLENAVEARRKANEGGAVIENAASAINKIKDSSSEIGKMVSLIDSIAFQTNLLALNAGVEAARAGESGKGFAVVANEVRELAQRSGDSAASIKELIARSNADVSEGVERVNQMVGLLGEVVSRIADISDRIDNLAGASEASLGGVTEIREAILAVESTMNHIAALSEETSASSAELASRSAEMRRSIAHFDHHESAQDRLDHQHSAMAA
ncbi:MAG: methyl-accepting chemotaxis protein [Pseudomonadota bacterium]